MALPRGHNGPARVVAVVVLPALLPAVAHLPAEADLLIRPVVCIAVVVLEAVLLGEQQPLPS